VKRQSIKAPLPAIISVSVWNVKKGREKIRGKYQLFPKPEKVDICLLKIFQSYQKISLRDAASRSGTASSGHRM
jgi:hypothetical protein